MSPLTSAQQSFIDQMVVNNQDHRLIMIACASFEYRNNSGLNSEAAVSLADEIDRVAG